METLKQKKARARPGRARPPPGRPRPRSQDRPGPPRKAARTGAPCPTREGHQGHRGIEPLRPAGQPGEDGYPVVNREVRQRRVELGGRGYGLSPHRTTSWRNPSPASRPVQPSPPVSFTTRVDSTMKPGNGLLLHEMAMRGARTGQQRHHRRGQREPPTHLFQEIRVYRASRHPLLATEAFSALRSKTTSVISLSCAALLPVNSLTSAKSVSTTACASSACPAVIDARCAVPNVSPCALRVLISPSL